VWRVDWQQMLEEVCLKNGWEAPTYELHEAVAFDSKLYAYKVNAAVALSSGLVILVI